MAYSTTRPAPNYAGCVSLDAVIERLATEHGALSQMRSLGVSFLGIEPDGQVKLATAAHNIAGKFGFKEDRPAPPVVVSVAQLQSTVRRAT